MKHTALRYWSTTIFCRLKKVESFFFNFFFTSFWRFRLDISISFEIPCTLGLFHLPKHNILQAIKECFRKQRMFRRFTVKVSVPVGSILRLIQIKAWFLAHKPYLHILCSKWHLKNPVTFLPCSKYHYSSGLCPLLWI